jgi:hypothetical protein
MLLIGGGRGNVGEWLSPQGVCVARRLIMKNFVATFFCHSALAHAEIESCIAADRKLRHKPMLDLLQLLLVVQRRGKFSARYFSLPSSQPDTHGAFRFIRFQFQVRNYYFLRSTLLFV